MITNQQFLSKIKGFKLEGWIKKAWKRLPAEARKVLLNLWTKKELEFSMIPDFDKAYKKFHRCNFIAATTTTTTSEFMFSRFMFNEIDEPAGIAIIAHELCHAYRYAKGLEASSLAKYKKARDGANAEEILVDKTIAKWGFDVRAVNIFFELFKIKHDPKARAKFEKQVNAEVDRQLCDFKENMNKEMGKLAGKFVAL